MGNAGSVWTNHAYTEMKPRRPIQQTPCRADSAVAECSCCFIYTRWIKELGVLKNTMKSNG
jgi:hypothetical protein